MVANTKTSTKTSKRKSTKPNTKQTSATASNQRVVARKTSSKSDVGNPFQNPNVSKLYPERSNNVEVAKTETPHSRIAKLSGKPTKTKRATRRKESKVVNHDSLIANVNVDRREYQVQAATAVIRAFAENKHGSVLLRGSSECGKMIITLMIVQELQKRLGLTVAWAGNPRRLAKLKVEIAERGFDVKIQPVDVYDHALRDSNTIKADLLIMDQNSMDNIEIVDQLGESLDPQIVLGLSSGIFLKMEVRDCFDAEVSCTVPVRLRDEDLALKQEKLPRMPVV